VADNDFLNFSAPTARGWGYCVFGRVVEGQDVIETMRSVPTTSKAGHQDVPSEDIVITRAELVEG
jgi:peptidyl-prolyl cis-trans isomerase B (cyclophilin B)